MHNYLLGDIVYYKNTKMGQSAHPHIVVGFTEQIIELAPCSSQGDLFGQKSMTHFIPAELSHGGLSKASFVTLNNGLVTVSPNQLGYVSGYVDGLLLNMIEQIVDKYKTFWLPTCPEVFQPFAGCKYSYSKNVHVQITTNMCYEDANLKPIPLTIAEMKLVATGT